MQQYDPDDRVQVDVAEFPRVLRTPWVSSSYDDIGPAVLILDLFIS